MYQRINIVIHWKSKSKTHLEPMLCRLPLSVKHSIIYKNHLEGIFLLLLGSCLSWLHCSDSSPNSVRQHGKIQTLEALISEYAQGLVTLWHTIPGSLTRGKIKKLALCLIVFTMFIYAIKTDKSVYIGQCLWFQFHPGNATAQGTWQ